LFGSLALAGFPFTAGFFSKDMIIHHALEVNPFLGWIGIITAALTAFYTFRMVFLAFFGEKRVPQGVHAHESGWWMLIPLTVLAIGALGTGAIFHHHLPEFLHGIMVPFAKGQPTELHHWSPMLVGAMSGAIAVLGILIAWVGYVALPELPESIKNSWSRVFTYLHNKYYVDEGYDALIVTPLRQLGNFFYAFDRYAIDGLVWLVTAVPRLLGFMLRSLQNGALQGYGVTMATGFGIILLLALLYS